MSGNDFEMDRLAHELAEYQKSGLSPQEVAELAKPKNEESDVCETCGGKGWVGLDTPCVDCDGIGYVKGENGVESGVESGDEKVSVIRCKDCKYSLKIMFSNFIQCQYSGNMVKGNHFCSDGEKKKGLM